MTTPVERPSPEIRALVDALCAAVENDHAAAYGPFGDDQPAKEALFAALGALEQDAARWRWIKPHLTYDTWAEDENQPPCGMLDPIQCVSRKKGTEYRITFTISFTSTP